MSPAVACSDASNSETGSVPESDPSALVPEEAFSQHKEAALDNVSPTHSSPQLWRHHAVAPPMCAALSSQLSGSSQALTMP
jgi:hypothetical protein